MDAKVYFIWYAYLHLIYPLRFEQRNTPVDLPKEAFINSKQFDIQSILMSGKCAETHLSRIYHREDWSYQYACEEK